MKKFKKYTSEQFKQLYKSGQWMLRLDKDGAAYGDFRWNAVGEMTIAPDFTPEPCCGGGLHGTNNRFNGFRLSGTRMVLCRTYGKQISIDGNKLKVQKARIVAINEQIPEYFLTHGSFDLYGYTHALPQGFTHCDGGLYLNGYNHKLPDGLTHCGGDLNLREYKHKLPDGFTHCDGNIYLSGYEHKLPDGFTHCGGNIYLSGYKHKLPDGFTY